MIYLVDQPLTDTSHSKFIIEIIKANTATDIKLVEINNPIKYEQLTQIFLNLIKVVHPVDIVLCPWCVLGNNRLDYIISELGDICSVVAAAGNFSEPIEKYSPARIHNVITVGTLNKQGLVASLSNYSNSKEIIWIPGTNYYDSDNNSYSGTSVSSALYASFLAEAYSHNDLNLLDILIKQEIEKVFAEINNLT